VSEPNFLEKYNDLLQLDRAELEQIWNHYDRDRSGFIEAGGELEAFVRDMLEVSGESITELVVADVVSGILDLVDVNADGKLSFTELDALLKQD
jgi:Ca2+-binding EF-hand superfamily protein